MAKKISEKEWDTFVKETLKSFAYSAMPNRGDNVKTAKALGISKSAVDQMKSHGKGSPKTWFKLMAHHAGLSPEEISSLFTNFPSLLKEVKPLSELDLLFEELKKNYTKNEIAAWLKLLISKKEIEDFIGVNIKVSSKKK